MTVAIIGGGVSGAAIAYHLAHAPAQTPISILVFEPRADIGRGLAYDTADPAHRINVPASRMSLLPNEPDHFMRWIEHSDGVADDPDATRVDGSLFPRRHVFGSYIHSCLRPLLETGRVRHVRRSVSHVEKMRNLWRLTSQDGEEFAADILVLAATHPSPRPPAQLAALAGHPRFVADPTRHDALDAIRPDDRILIVGNGLTAADVVASLALRGHRAQILALSRRGLRSRGHAPFAQEPYGDFLEQPPRTALELLIQIRKTIRAAEKERLTWHAVLDQVRHQGQALWQRLPIAEKRRIVRHLRPYWDTHRFRIAPQVERVLEEAIAEGRLEIAAGSIVSSRLSNGAMAVTLKRKAGEQFEQSFDAVVITTGPAHGAILTAQPWLAEMAQAGHLRLDATGLGLACDAEGRAVSTAGEANRTLFIGGPLARGYFGELMGLPQVTEYAAYVAEKVSDALQDRSLGLARG